MKTQEAIRLVISAVLLSGTAIPAQAQQIQARRLTDAQTEAMIWSGTCAGVRAAGGTAGLLKSGGGAFLEELNRLRSQSPAPQAPSVSPQAGEPVRASDQLRANRQAGRKLIGQAATHARKTVGGRRIGIVVGSTLLVGSVCAGLSAWMSQNRGR